MKNKKNGGLNKKTIFLKKARMMNPQTLKMFTKIVIKMIRKRKMIKYPLLIIKPMAPRQSTKKSPLITLQQMIQLTSLQMMIRTQLNLKTLPKTILLFQPMKQFFQRTLLSQPMKQFFQITLLSQPMKQFFQITLLSQPMKQFFQTTVLFKPMSQPLRKKATKQMLTFQIQRTTPITKTTVHNQYLSSPSTHLTLQIHQATQPKRTRSTFYLMKPRLQTTLWY